MKRRAEPEIFSMSLLDTITAGFGAVMLLLVLTKTAEPTIVVRSAVQLRARAEQLQQLAEQTADQAKALEAELAASRAQLAAAQAERTALRVSADKLQNKTVETRQQNTVATTLESQLASARESLTEEMRRLYRSNAVHRADAPIGGIPIDSEYIIFVIDTSGSMQQFAWRTMNETMHKVLNIYPKVRGLQVMSDMGDYMFSSYRGKWIPDTPGQRKLVLDVLRTWQPFSESNPAPGIEAAVRDFAARGKKISIYVFGDEFTGPSIAQVLQTVARLNPKDAQGNPLVRINAIGFPTQYVDAGVSITGVRFAALMSLLCEENGGAFVALRESH
ncbi:MAG: VWA domain-containing protein [Gammaproteobacteria bacterium]|nr:VWA domain-containing protein [Gammaproteobacteria bacterium]